MAIGDISLMIQNHNGKIYEKLDKGTVTRTTRLNNEEFIQVDIELSERNSKVLSLIDRRWSFEVATETQYGYTTITYVITDVSDDIGFGNNPVTIIAIRSYIDHLKRSVVYEESNGSMTFKARVLFALSTSGYSVNWANINDTQLYATVMEGFGYASAWELLNRTVEFYGIEYSVDDKSKTIIFYHKKGTDQSDYIRYSVNLKTLLRSRDFSKFATYGRAFGAWKDDEDHSKGRYEATYESPLATIYGLIPLNPPVVDERFKIIDSLHNEVRARVMASVIDSTTVDIDSLTFDSQTQGGTITVGDSILLVDNDNAVRENVRVVEIMMKYSEFGEKIDVQYTIGDYSQEYRNNKKSVALNKLV